MDCSPEQKKLVVVERWPLAEVRLYFAYYTCCFLNFLVAIVVAVVLGTLRNHDDDVNWNVKKQWV